MAVELPVKPGSCAKFPVHFRSGVWVFAVVLSLPAGVRYGGLGDGVRDDGVIERSFGCQLPPVPRVWDLDQSLSAASK